MRNRILLTTGLGFLALGFGCAPKAQIKKIENPPPRVQKPVPVEEPSFRGKEYQEVPELAPVYFDFDQSTLRNEARETLQKNYKALQNHADWEVLIEGHCDERGSTEYNLGLGQRRAAAIREYYMTLGAEGARIATLSFGKEKPVCTEQHEDCWSKNRRGLSKVRSSAEKPAPTNTP